MMTPMQTDLIKYSTPAAPTSHERQALRARRQARRATFLAFIEKVFTRSGHGDLNMRRCRKTFLY
ncbi:hypothetical protein SuNHUV7_05340 (plasmid) [Pseudoseohaeicola sp. NH-UV-7]|nr:hypothetical protein [Sulfitobacter sp. JL08]AXI54085.1 hypothetical protein C1J05_05910 [Sulfitobacter sp. JL08]